MQPDEDDNNLRATNQVETKRKVSDGGSKCMSHLIMDKILVDGRQADHSWILCCYLILISDFSIINYNPSGKSIWRSC